MPDASVHFIHFCRWVWVPSGEHLPRWNTLAKETHVEHICEHHLEWNKCNMLSLVELQISFVNTSNIEAQIDGPSS